MAKMKERNTQLKSALGQMAPKERVVEVINMPKYDTVNRQGYGAYGLEDELRLISMLNTLKLEPQFYRSENETMRELRDLIERIGSKDPYFVAQAIVYSRCMGEGMRSINHLAAALVAPFISGQEYAKRFYGLFNKKEQRGGCIFRPDDMQEIKDVFDCLNNATLSNAMKKGFASVLQLLDTYQLCKYKSTVIDIANLVHPNPELSAATVIIDGKKMKTLDALMKGINISADTWEVAQSEAGQEVAKAVREGKLTESEAKVVLEKAKDDNWEALLNDGKLGILAALRNLRNMLIGSRPAVITKVCELVSNPELIRKGKIMPYQIDLAAQAVRDEFGTGGNAGKVLAALEKGYIESVPNLKEALPGKTLVVVDCSGSMNVQCYNAKTGKRIGNTAAQKAGLIAATIAQATGGDVIRFGSRTEWFSGNFKASGVFDLGNQIGHANMGGTSLETVFNKIHAERKVYDRIVILSDNECNGFSQGRGWNSSPANAYKQYVHDVCSPYVYEIDLAAYGTMPLKNDGKVNYYYGYGYAMFDDIASREFNPAMHIEKVRKVII